MGRRYTVVGPRAAAIAALIGLVLLWTAIRAVPGAASSLGLSGGHAVTFLNSGSIYTEARPGAWLIGSPKRRSSLVFARAGQRIILDSRAAIERGRVMISLSSGPWTGSPILVEHITASGHHTSEALVPDTGFYRMSANYVFNFRGRHDLDWRVDRPSPLQRVESRRRRRL